MRDRRESDRANTTLLRSRGSFREGRRAAGSLERRKDLNKWWCGFRLARAFLYMMEETEERARRCAAVPPPLSIANWRSGRGRKQKAA